MKKFLNDKKNILIILFDILFSIIITLRICNDRIEISDIKNLNIYLFLLVNIFVFYISSHFLFEIKKVYDFLFKNRYIIAVLILFIIVLGKFHGSSIGMWNDYVQPNQDYSYTKIIGTNRAIRSDEWLVNTPYAFSQEGNDYGYYNYNARASKTDMFSSIFTPVKSLLILTRPFNIIYILFGNEYGLSFYWYGRLIALLLVTFEFLRLLSKNNKLLSLMGAIALTGSSVVLWWYSNYIVDLLISSQLTLLLFNQYLKEKSKKNRILCSIGIGWSFSWFIMVLYPAWQIPLGYLSLIFAIYIFTNNLNKNKEFKDYLYLLISIFIVIVFLIIYFHYGLSTLRIIIDTVYPGKRISIGGNYGLQNFTYIYSLLFPFKDIGNPCEYSIGVSLFPIPLVISIFYILKNLFNKNKNFIKDNLLIILLTMLSLIFTLYTFFEIPVVISKILLLSYCPSERIIVILSIINLYLLILLVGKIKINKWYQYLTVILFAISTSILCIYFAHSLYPNYLNFNINVILTGFLFALILTFLLSYKKIYKYIFIGLMIFVGIINLVFINPISYGTDVIYKKDASKKIQKVVNSDKDAVWISYNSITLQNFALLNNAKVLNSTNIYPNLKIWYKLDKNKKYLNVYNRYAHIVIKFTDNNTTFKLNQSDMFTLNLNYNDIDKLNVKYVLSSENLMSDVKFINKFHSIYEKDGIYIYKLNN